MFVGKTKIEPMESFVGGRSEIIESDCDFMQYKTELLKWSIGINTIGWNETRETRSVLLSVIYYQK